ncbi:MAG: GlsB/YeaQ/YmgE family stress response membrane protein [Chloroflexi bacterium]|nr:GlsB/YeaQ/YmgE family stress response membrane protein [Chloroflexota bacterium]
MDILVLVVVGLVLGFLSDTLTPGRVPFGWLLGVVLGIVGAAAAVYLLPPLLGLYVAGVAIVNVVVGAIVLTVAVKLIIAFATRRPTD